MYAARQPMTARMERDWEIGKAVYRLREKGAMLPSDLTVGMPIDKGIQTADVGDHLFTCPGRGRQIVSKVAHCDDFGCTGSSYAVHGELHVIVKRLTVIAARDPIAVVAVIVLEIGRRGFYD